MRIAKLFKFYLKGSPTRAKPKQLLTLIELKQKLHYDPETGIFIWLANVGKRRKIGCIAGTKTKKGYIQIRINNKPYLAHRLAYFYMYGEWLHPDKDIDHKDGNKSNNKWSNLRPCLHAQNMQNRLIQVNNKCGYKGVYKKKGFNYKKPYCARITVKGKVILLGSYPTAKQAYAEYLKASKLLFNEFHRES